MDNIWVILKYVGPTFSKIMAKRLDKGRFFSESFRLWCNDNFIGKGIPHYHIQLPFPSFTAHRWLSWLSTGLSRGRSRVQFRPDQHSGNYICKWLDFQVFSDKDDKPEVPSHNPSMLIILWDVKEPTHLSLRVGHVVPGVVVCLLLCIMVGRVKKGPQ